MTDDKRPLCGKMRSQSAVERSRPKRTTAQDLQQMGSGDRTEKSWSDLLLLEVPKRDFGKRELTRKLRLTAKSRLFLAQLV
jgi:hypothetical protein